MPLRPQEHKHLSERQRVRFRNASAMLLMLVLTITTPYSSTLSLPFQPVLVVTSALASLVFAVSLVFDRCHKLGMQLFFGYAVLRSVSYVMAPTIVDGELVPVDYLNFEQAAGRYGVVAIWVYIAVNKLMTRYR